MGSERRDYAKEIVDQILDSLKAGVKPWTASWDRGGVGQLPLRSTGDRYQGINVLTLWSQALRFGYTNPHWLTFQQAIKEGTCVKKGERGTPVCYFGSVERDDPAGGDPKTVRFARFYFVFNVHQLEAIPDRYQVPAALGPGPERLDAFEAWIARTGAEIHHGGNAAYYNPNTDRITMPDRARFKDAEQLAAVTAHELVHWTGAKHRLDRNLSDYALFSREERAAEELVAEVGSALIGAAHGHRPDHLEDHSAYIGMWIKALSDDPKALFQAAAKAQAAVNYLESLTGEIAAPTELEAAA